jgi:hypothetical protein
LIAQDEKMESIILTYLNDDELREIGWTQDMIDISLSSDVLAFFFIADGDLYAVERSLRNVDYEIRYDVKFREQEWKALITTWA